MLSTRRLWWAALVLASLPAGCAKETTTTPSETPAVSSTPAPGPAPETPPSTTPAVGKDGMKADMTPEAATPGKADTSTPDAKGETPGDIKIEAPTVTPATKSDAPKSAAADDSKLSEVEVAEIKKLPGDEPTLALKQIACPVSGEHLGSMEAPIKVSAEGKTFFLCCASCKPKLEKNPKEYVAKLAGK